MERKRNRQENERCGRKEKEKRKGKYTQRERERGRKRERRGERERESGWKQVRKRKRQVGREREKERERVEGEEEGGSARERERRSGIASTLAVPQWYRAATPPFAPTVPLLPLPCPTHPAYIIHPHYEPPLGSVIALYSLLCSLERVQLHLCLAPSVSPTDFSLSPLPRFRCLASPRLLRNLVFSRLP